MGLAFASSKRLNDDLGYHRLKLPWVGSKVIAAAEGLEANAEGFTK